MMSEEILRIAASWLPFNCNPIFIVIVPTSPQTSAIKQNKGRGNFNSLRYFGSGQPTMCNKQSPRQNDIMFPIREYKSSDAGVLAHYLHGSNCPDSSSR